MYEAFYGLREKPFSLLPDPSFLYFGRPHSMAYAVLEYGVLSQAGFTVITGEVGCGKTTLIRHLLNQLDRDVTVGLLTNTAGLRHDLLRWILLAFRQDFRLKEQVELHAAFEDFLIGEYAAGRRTVLLVDEAQNLAIETIEELRMLSNINADKDLLLQMVLVGQPQLKAKLEAPELEQFAQRISASYHLGRLSKEETIAYIRHRLRQAGGPETVFTLPACVAIFTQSGGVPRLINVLCDLTLVYGYSEGLHRIDEELVQEVIRDRAQGIQQPEEKPVTAPAAVPEDATEKVAYFDRDMARELFSTLRRK